MMLKPSIDSLLDKVNSKYSLVILSSKRAHELDEGETHLLDKYYSVKSVGQALEEVDAGDIMVHPNPELKREVKRRKAEEMKVAREREQKELEEKMEKEKK